MNSFTTPNTKPTATTTATAHANLNIRLQGWPGTTAVGIISIAVVTIFGLFFKYKA